MSSKLNVRECSIFTDYGGILLLGYYTLIIFLISEIAPSLSLVEITPCIHANDNTTKSSLLNMHCAAVSTDRHFP